MHFISHFLSFLIRLSWTPRLECNSGREASLSREVQNHIKGCLGFEEEGDELRSRVHSDSDPRAHLSGSNQSLLVFHTYQYHYTLLYTSIELVFDSSAPSVPVVTPVQR